MFVVEGLCFSHPMCASVGNMLVGTPQRAVLDDSNVPVCGFTIVMFSIDVFRLFILVAVSQLQCFRLTGLPFFEPCVPVVHPCCFAIAMLLFLIDRSTVP